jgi:hypothetical protein
LKPIKTPMSEGFHSEIDDTTICTEEASAKYGYIIGCCIWIILLGMSDIAHAVSVMRRFNMSPREGFLKATKWILAFPKGMIILDAKHPKNSTYPIEDHPIWKKFYASSEKESNWNPKLRGPKVWLIVYVDADHTHYLVTRRSVTDIPLIFNDKPFI